MAFLVYDSSRQSSRKSDILMHLYEKNDRLGQKRYILQEKDVAILQNDSDIETHLKQYSG